MVRLQAGTGFVVSESSETGNGVADGSAGAVSTRSYGWLKYGVGPAIGVGAGGGAGVGAIFGQAGTGAAVGAAIGVAVGAGIASTLRKRSAC